MVSSSSAPQVSAGQSDDASREGIEYLAAWSQSHLGRAGVTLSGPAKVEGIHDVHTGPSWRFAKVMVSAEPAQEFSVCFDLEPELIETLQKDGWLDEAIFGILDVLAVARPAPIFGVSLRIVHAEYDDVRSSRIAFRMAGRDAARGILESTAQASS